MISLSRCLGFITALSLLLAMVPLNGGYFGSLLDIPALVFVALGTVAILLVGCDTSSWRTTFDIVFRHRAHRSVESIDLAEQWFQLASRASMMCGIIWGVFSTILLLSDDAPIWPTSTLVLLGPAYGLVLSEFVFHPLGVAVRSMARRPQSSNSERG